MGYRPGHRCLEFSASTARATLVVLAIGAFDRTVASADVSRSTLTASATDSEIVERIVELGDPSYAIRSNATRRLCAIGNQAAERLRAAASSDNVEVALRARHILGAFENLWFGGAAVSLTLSSETVSWEESVDLLIAIENRSTSDAKIPFELRQTERTALHGDARQVADMIDAADWLHVIGPDGQDVSLRVDDITADAAVAAAIQRRVDGDEVQTMSPGERVTVRLRAFNRGWARFPMLDRGTYRIVFDYSPAWDDAVLVAAQVGRVVSNEARLVVTQSAPPGVSRRGLETSITIEEQGDWLVALLVNRADQTAVVNKNFGASPPFAQARWIYDREGTLRDVPFLPKANPGLHDFDEALFAEVTPGQAIEVARIKTADFRARLTQSGVELRDRAWEAYFNYSNLCDRPWQAKQHSAFLENPAAPDVLRKPLPRRIITGWHSSNRLKAPGAD